MPSPTWLDRPNFWTKPGPTQPILKSYKIEFWVKCWIHFNLLFSNPGSTRKSLVVVGISLLAPLNAIMQQHLSSFPLSNVCFFDTKKKKCKPLRKDAKHLKKKFYFFSINEIMYYFKSSSIIKRSSKGIKETEEWIKGVGGPVLAKKSAARFACPQTWLHLHSWKVGDNEKMRLIMLSSSPLINLWPLSFVMSRRQSLSIQTLPYPFSQQASRA